MNEPVGTIYDLGYKRYLGGRRKPATRWRVIARHQIAYAWAKWWRVKLYIGFAALITALFAGPMIFASSKTQGTITANGMIMSALDEQVFEAYIVLPFLAFFVGLTVGCRIVAADLKTGAFTFYFVRPVRPIDYLIGKLVGLWVMIAVVVLGPMLVLALIRIGISGNASGIVDNLALLPKAIIIGGLASLAYASIALAFSALFAKPWLNRIMWAVYFLIVLQFFVKGPLMMAFHTPDVATIDPLVAIIALVFRLNGVAIGGDSSQMPSLAAALIGLGANIVLGAAIVYWRVNAAATKGIGGGS